MSLKEQIAAAEDLPSKEITVEEWGGARLLLRALNGEDYVWFAKAVTSQGTGGQTDMINFVLEYASALIQRGTWDPDQPTERVFAPEDVAGILDLKSFGVRQRLALQLVKLTSPSEEEVSAEKKDSSAGETADSGSS